MRCRVCEREVEPGARFCPHCGAALSEACAVCGQPLQPEHRFCPACGTARGPSELTASTRPLSPSESETSPTYQRRLVTILFADITSFTSLSETIDPEELLDIMSGAYPCLSDPVRQRGGTVVQLLGDSVLAYFGAPVAKESDPEQAVSAGLEIAARIQAYAGDLQARRSISGFNVRVGINTGLVVVGDMGPDPHLEATALGDAVNLAARLQQNAPPGGVLISQETYRHIRSLFEVQPKGLLTVKGRAQAVNTFLVTRRRPPTWHTRTRGLEGVETPMIGREPEMLALQQHCREVLHSGPARPEARLVVINGQPGVGKSRLLDEFAAWAESGGEMRHTLRGRTSAAGQAAPMALLRDVFAHRFDILESDSAAQAIDKFRLGMCAGPQACLKPEQADLVGQLVGFDFSASPAVSRLLGSLSFSQVAAIHLIAYLRSLAHAPTLLLLEDLHWADDASLDLLSRLLEELNRADEARFMCVATTRPTLFERRARWGEGLSGFARLDLEPLSRARSRALVNEILRNVENLPSAFVERVVEDTDGNPYFIEEMIQMYIDEGVIVPEDHHWRVEEARATGRRIPATLTGILQARLDSLPVEERDVLQRAAVVGRVFWNGVVGHLAGAPQEASRVSERLASLNQRKLIYQRERSSIAGQQEYLFTHALLRDAAYETVLLRQRRQYHQRVAEWIVGNTGERQEEHLALIARHFAEGGQPEQAVEWFTRAGERALKQGAPREACRQLDQALALLPEGEASRRRWRALAGRSEALGVLGEQTARQADDAALLMLAATLGDEQLRAEAYYRTASQAAYEGEYAAALAALDRALEADRLAGHTKVTALALPLKVYLLTIEGRLAEAAQIVDAALNIAQLSQDMDIITRSLTNVSSYYLAAGDLARGVELLQQQVEISRRQGHIPGEANGLTNLGYHYLSLGLFEEGQSVLQEAIALSEQAGARRAAAYCKLNLGLACWRLGQLERAGAVLEDAQQDFTIINDAAALAFGKGYQGLVFEQAGKPEQAKATYTQALEAFSRYGLNAQAAEAQAGLARVALGEQDLPQAVAHAARVLPFLENKHGQGMELPFLAYLTCVEVYQKTGDNATAGRLLQDCTAELLERAERISHSDWRRSFLECIPEHRRILTLSDHAEENNHGTTRRKPDSGN